MPYPGFSEVKGWCPALKADRLQALASNADVCCEIGVFAGQSFFAMVHGNPKATLYAIDPWAAEDAAQKVAPGAEEGIDFNAIHAEFFKVLAKFGAINRTIVLRMPSNIAIDFVFENIDLLHIDGNHDADKVMWDVQNWLPKMKHGGTIVLDDTDWSSVAPAAEWLKKNCSECREFATWAEFKLN